MLLGDFGLAFPFLKEGEQITQILGLRGTLAYGSPEQLQSRTVSVRSCAQSIRAAGAACGS